MRDALELLAKAFFEFHAKQFQNIPRTCLELHLNCCSQNRMLHAMRSIYRFSCELLASGQRFWIPGLNLWTSGLNFWTSGLNFFGWPGERCLHSCDLFELLVTSCKLVRHFPPTSSELIEKVFELSVFLIFAWRFNTFEMAIPVKVFDEFQWISKIEMAHDMWSFKNWNFLRKFSELRGLLATYFLKFM